MSGRFNYLVLGAGRQGAALAFDLAMNCEAQRVVLADVSAAVADKAVARLRKLIDHSGQSPRLKPGAPAPAAADADADAGRGVECVAVACDVARPESLQPLFQGVHVALSAVPYRFNVALTDVAVAAGVCFCDLGGNTGVVREQLQRHEAAKRAGVSVVPDCGLAPGLGNILAAHGVRQLAAKWGETQHGPGAARGSHGEIDVHVRCGGLPESPVGPLGYKLVFNFEGLINEYSGLGEYLREGKRIDVPTLTEVESIELERADGVGGWTRQAYEAAVTSGGTSTCPESFAGRVRTYDYKTVRYPGHFAVIRAMFGLGCFEERVTLRDGRVVEPRSVTRALFEERLGFPEMRDIVFLRAEVSGETGGRHGGTAATAPAPVAPGPAATRVTLRYDLFDRHDERTGFTAMERTTAFPTALVAHLQARKEIAVGALPLEQCLPTDVYMRELGRHDIDVRVSQTGG